MPPPRPSRRRAVARDVVLALGLMALLGGLSGCSQALEEIALGGSPLPRESAAIDVRNDLAAGPLTKKITAGDAVLTVSYSSILPANRWTAAEEKPLSLQVTAELTRGAGRAVYLTLLRVSYGVTGHSVVLPAPAPFTDRVIGPPGFALGAPGDYRQTLMLPPLEEGADTVRLAITYVVLVASAPGSVRYTKQTVTDSLTIAIVH